MKKYFILIILISFIFQAFTLEKPVGENEELIKRTILILPFINKNNVESYEYLSETLKKTLKTELTAKELFMVKTYQEKDTAKLLEIINDTEKSKKLAVDMKCDVIIYGEYIIIEESLKIIVEAYDVFTNQNVASTHITGEVGLDIFRLIDESALDMADKLSQKLKPVKKSYFDEMTELLKKERRMNIKKNITPLNKTGIGLTAGGGGMFLAGFTILIFDLAYYNNLVRDKLYNNPGTDAGYADYYESYQTNIALLASSISIIGVSAVLLSIGIPFIFIKKKNKDVSLNIRTDNGIGVEFCLRF